MKNAASKTAPKDLPKLDYLFVKSFRLLKSNPNKAGLMVLFDVLFLVSAFGLQTLFKYFAQSLNISIAIPKTTSAAFIYIAFSLIYYLIALFAYSFFKYCILDFIKSLFNQTVFSFKRLGQFYSLNIAIAGIFFAVMIALNFLLASIKQAYQPFAFIFMAVPYSLVLYLIVNTSHSLFYEGASTKESVKKSFSVTFTKIKDYREIILALILSAFALWLLFFGSGYLIRMIASKNYNLYLTSYAYFKQASVIVFDIAFYLVILINRVSFYATIREIK